MPLTVSPLRKRSVNSWCLVFFSLETRGDPFLLRKQYVVRREEAQNPATSRQLGIDRPSHETCCIISSAYKKKKLIDRTTPFSSQASPKSLRFYYRRHHGWTTNEQRIHTDIKQQATNGRVRSTSTFRYFIASPAPSIPPHPRTTLLYDRQEIRRVTSEVNFKTKDLATLVAALQFLLQSCPKNNLIRFKNLKYLGGGEKTALDNTPFAPARGKKNAEIVVDEGNFSPDVFLAMSKVTLIAEAEVEEEVRLLVLLSLFGVFVVSGCDGHPHCWGGRGGF